ALAVAVPAGACWAIAGRGVIISTPSETYSWIGMKRDAFMIAKASPCIGTRQVSSRSGLSQLERSRRHGEREGAGHIRPVAVHPCEHVGIGGGDRDLLELQEIVIADDRATVAGAAGGKGVVITGLHHLERGRRLRGEGEVVNDIARVRPRRAIVQKVAIRALRPVRVVGLTFGGAQEDHSTSLLDADGYRIAAIIPDRKI